MRLAVAYLFVSLFALPVGSALAQPASPPPAAAATAQDAAQDAAGGTAPASTTEGPSAAPAAQTVSPEVAPAAPAGPSVPEAALPPPSAADAAKRAADAAMAEPPPERRRDRRVASDAPTDAAAPIGGDEGEEWVPRLGVSGYAKVGFLWQFTDDAAPDYIGHSNGFRMGAARVELAAEPMVRSRLVLSVEGALDSPTDPLGVAGEKLVSVRDAYLSYELHPAARLTVGQFKAPFLAETLVADAGMLFLDRSIVARGVRPPEGFDTSGGLSLDRQLGASLSSRRLALGSLGFGYAVGVFNGNGANRLLNDNRSLTPVVRLTADWSETVALGVAAHRNPRTTGLRPDLNEEVDTGVTADVAVHVGNLRLLSAYAVRTRAFEDLQGAPDDRAQGMLVELSWLHERLGLEPAYRFGLFDPSNLSGVEQVMHHTFALNWHPSEQPLRVFAAYTLRLEQTERTVANDGVDLGLRLNF